MNNKKGLIRWGRVILETSVLRFGGVGLGQNLRFDSRKKKGLSSIVLGHGWNDHDIIGV